MTGGKVQVVIKSNNPPLELHLPNTDAVLKKGACTLVFHTLHGNVRNAMKEYFIKNTQGRTLKIYLSVKLLLMKTALGRERLYFLAAKEFNHLALQGRKIGPQHLSR